MMPKAVKFFCQDRIKNRLLCPNGLVCGKGFNRNGDLSRHRKIHTGIKQHECHFCQQTFQQKTQLKNHANVHTGETPHHCDICHEKFKDPSSCSRHRKEQHEGNYVCFVDGCRKTIARKSNFRSHLQSHKAYRSNMALEDYWVRRNPPRPKRIERKTEASKKCVIKKIDSPPPTAQEERCEPIKMPQLYPIAPTSRPYQPPYPANVTLPHILPNAIQSQESLLRRYQSDMTLELELQEFINAQNSQFYSPSDTPLFSSLSSFPGSSYLDPHQLEANPGFTESYPQPLPYPMQLQLGSGLLTPPSWIESLMPNYETLPLRIDGLDLVQSSISSGPSLYAWSAGVYSPFTANLQMAT